MAQKVTPSLIFVNPAIAGTSGLEMCKEIHDMEPLRNVPIVVLTTFKGTIDPRYTSLYGIVDSLKKPFSPEELISKTENVLGEKSAHVEPVTEPVIEEDVSSDESEQTIAIEEPVIPEIPKEIDEERDVSDKTMEWLKEEEIVSSDKAAVKQILHEKPEEIIEKKPKKTYTMKRPLRRDTKKRLFVPIIAVVVIIILGAAGIVLFKIVPLPWEKVQAPVAVRPPETVQEKPVDIAPSQEQQKPQEAIVEKRPDSIPSPAPTSPVPQPEVKPSGKVIYSVQIGAFENKNNAETLAKQYKEKGYETFVHTTTPKDKKTLYRVLIGKFENKKEASRFAENIIKKEKIKASIARE